MSACHRYNDSVEIVPNICPACGYDGLEEPPWTDGSASDEICPSCGIQFGYEDFAGGDVDARKSVHAAAPVTAPPTPSIGTKRSTSNSQQNPQPTHKPRGRSMQQLAANLGNFARGDGKKVQPGKRA